MVVAGLASRQLGAHSELGLVQALGWHLARLRAGRAVSKRQDSALRWAAPPLGHQQPLRGGLVALVLQLQMQPERLIRAVLGRRKRARGKEPSQSNDRKL